MTVMIAPDNRQAAIRGKSEWFNAQLLKSLRAELGWTQQELAQRSRLSVRVIAKAEAGEVVSHGTIRTLANCLATAGIQVSYQDFVIDPLDVVQKFFHSYATCSADLVTRLASLLAPNVEVCVGGGSASDPLSGFYQGRNEFTAVLQKYRDIFVRDGGTLGFDTQMRLVGREVIAWGNELLRVPEAPAAASVFMMLRFRVENGEIVEIEWLYDGPAMMSRVNTWATQFPQAPWTKHFNFISVDKQNGVVLPSECHSQTLQF